MEGSKAPPTSEQQMNQFRLRDKMALLNNEFLTVIKHYHQEKPSYDFTATMNSYIEHVKELRVMYKIDEPEDVNAKSSKKKVSSTQNADTNVSKPVEKESASIAGRKIAKATRRHTPATGSSSAKSNVTAVFAASSPATTVAPPKFGDISMIPKETPAPIEKQKPAATDTVAPPPARKRAIRGGGPLGGSERVIFKSGNKEYEENSAEPSVPSKLPLPTIKFPEPSKDFWAKKPEDKNSDEASKPSDSLFGFLKAGGPAVPKFSGFSFGKQTENQEKAKESDDQKKKDEKPALSFPKFDSSPPKSNETPKPSTGLFSFGNLTEAKKDSESSKPALSFPSFGKSPISTTGSSPENKIGETAKPATLSFPSFGDTKPANGLSFGSSSGSGGLFGNLVAKAAENAKTKEGADGEDDEKEYVPPKAEAVENVEADAIMTNKVSVFKYSGKEYQKLGVGMMYIKNNDGKHSVLIRAATATGTVWLNSLCNAAMKATKADEKGEKIRLTCPTSATEMTTMLCRFGSSEAATKFSEKIAELTK